MADQIFKKNRITKEERKRKVIKLRSETWLFVCEGTKTEPQYIESLIDYANKSTAESPLKYKVEGVGRNTETLVKWVQNFFDCTEELYAKKQGIPYAKTFVLFDKDSFGNHQFNNAIAMAEQRGYIPIWSNECFELWYLLHFYLYSSNNGREAYFKRLSELLGVSYDKAGDVFGAIHTPNNLSKAMYNAKKLNDDSCCEKSASKRVPCTQMFKVIEAINRELKIDLTKANI